MEPGEEDDLSDTDVADAMGEVVNILAGMVKSRLSEICCDLNIGLPLFMDGQIEPSINQEAGAVELQLGEIDTQVVVVRQAKSP
jgi:CheY-specific phosphatase CheX